MSKLETPMIRKYWEHVGGTLIEEFLAVPRSQNVGQRLIDAVIIPAGQKKISKWNEVSIDGQDVICVQAKASRLGMYLMGQALFSAELLRHRFNTKSVLSVALCSRDDAVLRPLFEAYVNMKVVIIPQ